MSVEFVSQSNDFLSFSIAWDQAYPRSKESEFSSSQEMLAPPDSTNHLILQQDPNCRISVRNALTKLIGEDPQPLSSEALYHPRSPVPPLERKMLKQTLPLWSITSLYSTRRSGHSYPLFKSIKLLSWQSALYVLYSRVTTALFGTLLVLFCFDL